jgi:hypothetical protein
MLYKTFICKQIYNSIFFCFYDLIKVLIHLTVLNSLIVKQNCLIFTQ